MSVRKTTIKDDILRLNIGSVYGGRMAKGRRRKFAGKLPSIPTMRYLILVHMTLGEPLTAMEIHDRIFQGSGRTVVVYIPTLYAALKILEQEKLLGRNRPRTHAETPGEGEDGGDDEVRYHLRSEAIPLVAEDVASYTHLAKLGRAFIRRSEVKETASE